MDSAPGRFDPYKRYLVGVLLLIYAMNLMDRLTLSILLQDIKGELQLSDTQLGFLSGLAFALFYAGVGIPLARWADRGNRAVILAATTAAFSGAIAFTSVATNFFQLMIIRICAGAGEAGCQPTALSLISDYFSRDHRPRAVAYYLMGGPLALFCGYFVAGWLNELYGWRATCVIMAIPGLLLAALAATTLREPRRHAATTAPTAQLPQTALVQVLDELRRNGAYRHLLLGYSLQSFFVVGVVQWQPAFFMRSYGLSSGELGTWMAVSYGVTGLVGTWIGGELCARYARGDERRQLLGAALLFCVLAAVKPAIYLMPSYQLAFAVLAFGSFLGGLSQGPIYATMQTVVPAQIRATATAIVMFSANLIGSGLGPLASGILSDALTPTYGAEALRYVLVIMGPGYLWAGLHVWLASRHLRHV